MLNELRKMMEEYCAKAGIEYDIGLFTSADALLKSKNTFDLILLDIQMEGINGMDAAKLLRKRKVECPIVFITGNSQHVFSAFEVDAVNYLLKPVDKDKMFASLDKVFSKAEDKTLLIKQGHSYVKVSLKDIFYFEASSRKICIVTKHGSHSYYGKMKELVLGLNDNFFHCHRSYVINLEHVRSLNEKDVIMDNGDSVPVSRDKRRELADALLKYFRGVDSYE